MENTPKKAEFYETPDGRKPCEEWIDALRDRTARAKIRIRIERVRLGNLGKCDPVGEGVSELKLDYGPGYRVYIGQMGTHLVILLCGGDKSSQSKDIKTAKLYWEDYKRTYEKKGKR